MPVLRQQQDYMGNIAGQLTVCCVVPVYAGELEMRVFDTPGHTRGHVTYWFPEAKSLFPGEPAGCTGLQL